MAARNVYSIWIVPSGPVKERLANQVKRLSRSNGVTPFEPHLTLVKGIRMAERDAVRNTKELASSWKGFTILLGRPSSSGNFFKSIFIKVQKSRALVKAYRRASAAFRLRAVPYRPHVSLVYARLPAPRRRSIIRGLDMRGISGKFTANNLHLHMTEGKLKDWRCVYRTRISDRK
ncbi:MAG: 2'-5' RNA ligase family protein [Candidatus Micrarchaeota archaeon]|nr:2'-5' RNA ligase family protein [Candidatus Micrarchaeota archaeon]